MLFCDKSADDTKTPAATADAGKIRLGGGYRPATTNKDAIAAPTDAAAVPADTTDRGKIRLGGGYRMAIPGA